MTGKEPASKRRTGGTTLRRYRKGMLKNIRR